MPNHSFEPVLGIVKEEHACLDTDQKPCMDLINSVSVPNEENSKLLPGSSTGTAEMDDIEYWTISGKRPYFDLILTKSHVAPKYNLFLPTKILPELPCASVPVVLTSCGKSWNTFYHGGRKGKQFASSWKEFVIDNDLKIGDCCFFELMESTTTKIKFKVIILNGDLPVGEEGGDTPETAILIE